MVWSSLKSILGGAHGGEAGNTILLAALPAAPVGDRVGVDAQEGIGGQLAGQRYRQVAA
jgi:hypothetical protein